MVNYGTVLDLYTLDELLEMNDVTTEEALEFLVVHKIVRLPEPQELDFDSE